MTRLHQVVAAIVVMCRARILAVTGSKHVIVIFFSVALIFFFYLANLILKLSLVWIYWG